MMGPLRRVIADQNAIAGVSLRTVFAIEKDVVPDDVSMDRAPLLDRRAS
jgi:hypothetical protein